MRHLETVLAVIDDIRPHADAWTSLLEKYLAGLPPDTQATAECNGTSERSYVCHELAAMRRDLAALLSTADAQTDAQAAIADTSFSERLERLFVEEDGLPHDFAALVDELPIRVADVTMLSEPNDPRMPQGHNGRALNIAWMLARPSATRRTSVTELASKCRTTTTTLNAAWSRGGWSELFD